jgi:hypothetical protein
VQTVKETWFVWRTYSSYTSGASSADDPWRSERDYRLTVLTMQGMTLPRPGSQREE